MSPYTLDATGDVKILITHWAAMLLGCLWAFGYWLEGRKIHAPKILFVPIALYFALHILSGLASPYLGHSVPGIGLFASYFLLYIVAAHAFPDAKSLNPLLLTLVFAVAVSSAYAVVQWLGYDPFPWAGITQNTFKAPPGTFGNANVAGHTLVLAALAAAFLATNPRLRWCIVFALIFVVHEYYTGHRAGALALAGAITATLAIKASGSSTRRAIVSVTVIGVLAVAAAIAYTFATSQRIAPVERSLLLRYNSYFGAAEMIAERPFLGIGPGNYVVETPRFWTPYEQEWFETKSMMNEHVHNDVLESAVELGLGGALLYIAIFVLAISASMALAQRREAQGDRRLGLFFAAFFIAYGIDGLFGFNLRMPVSGCLFFIMAGALEGQFLEGSALVKQSRWAPSRLIHPVAVAGLALALAVLGTRVYQSELRFFQGKGFLQAKRYAEADQQWAEAEKLAPWNWLPARERGLTAFYQEDYERAIEHLERSATGNPYWIMTIVPLANIHLRRATQLPPENAAQRIDAYSSAWKFANDARAVSPENVSANEVAARAAYGLAKEKNGEADWAEAERVLERALALKTEKSATLRVMLAEANNHFDRKDEALAQLTLVVRGQPEVDSHWVRLYQQSAALGSYDTMRDELDSAIDANRAISPAPRALLASILQWRARILEAAYGDADAAAQDYEDARHFAPRDVVLWGRYAGFASRNDRISEFRDAVVSARKTAKGGSLPKAIKALAAAWSSEPPNITQAAQILSVAAEAPVGDGEKVGGAAQFGWAADLLLQEIQAARPDPTKTGPILYRLGLVYRAIRNHGQAAALFGAASGLLEAPEKTQSQQYWAEALAQTGQDEEAILILRRAVKATPSLYALRISLAQILARSGSIPEARTEYERLLHTTTLSLKDREQLQRELEALPK